jgi:spermidine/putrescine transport system ATP-binding protein
MSENAVELLQISKRFGPVVAVDHVSLSIHDGEFFSLLGPSGCGKTTSLRLIAGFELPSEGEVFIGGKPQGDTPAYRRPVNTVFQNYALCPHMTVAQNVAFGLEMNKVPKGEIRRRVGEALDLVQLPNMGNRKPDQLSGGQQQRVALARALVNRPKVLLLDEPLGALDLKLRKAMQLELKALQNRLQITFVYVTHDQEEALTMSDRIAVMSRGHVLQIGTPQQVYDRPTNRFVADFIGETNFLEGVFKARGADRGVVVVDGELPIRVPVEKSVEASSSVVIAIRPEKITVSEQPAGADSVVGTVEEVIYTGTDTRYLVRITSKSVLAVRQQNVGLGSAVTFTVGSKIHLHWAPQAARLLVE